MKYHINGKGEPAQCKATTKACPLGGEHYDSMREAASAQMDALTQRIEEIEQEQSILDAAMEASKARSAALTITHGELMEYRVGRANAEQQAFIESVLNEPEEPKRDAWLLDWLHESESINGLSQGTGFASPY